MAAESEGSFDSSSSGALSESFDSFLSGQQQQSACSTDHMVVALTNAFAAAPEPAQKLLLLHRALEATVQVADLERRRAGARAVLLVIGGFARAQRAALQAAYLDDGVVRGRIDGSPAPCCQLMVLVQSYSKGMGQGLRAKSCWRRVRSCCGAREREWSKDAAAALAWRLTHPEAATYTNSVQSSLGTHSSLQERRPVSKQVVKQLPLRPLSCEDCLALPPASRCCPVCFQDFVAGDEQRTLPCFHLFHPGCVDPWLLQHGDCPLCKTHAAEDLCVEVVAD